jgi:uncharacterized protein YpuA (DUF1002 family)
MSILGKKYLKDEKVFGENYKETKTNKKLNKKEIKAIKNILNEVTSKSNIDFDKTLNKLFKKHKKNKTFNKKKKVMKIRKKILKLIKLLNKKQIVSILKILKDKETFTFLKNSL